MKLRRRKKLALESMFWLLEERAWTLMRPIGEEYGSDEDGFEWPTQAPTQID